MALTETDPEIRNSKVYWFFVLDAAQTRGDFRAAERARHELARLGITVTYRRRQCREEAQHAD